MLDKEATETWLRLERLIIEYIYSCILRIQLFIDPCYLSTKLFIICFLNKTRITARKKTQK